MSELDVAKLARESGLHWWPPTLWVDLCKFADAVEKHTRDQTRQQLKAHIYEGVKQLEAAWPEVKP